MNCNVDFIYAASTTKENRVFIYNKSFMIHVWCFSWLATKRPSSSLEVLLTQRVEAHVSKNITSTYNESVTHSSYVYSCNISWYEKNF